MSISRRKFIRNSALVAATAMSARLANAEEPAALTTKGKKDSLTWDKAPCRFCGTGCHVMVGVDKKTKKVVAIAGDQKAEVNKGLCCVKGYYVGAILYGKDRLTTPMLKQGDRHVPISWDRALDIIASRIKTAPSKFAFYGSGQWTIPEGYAAQKFIKGGLSNNHIDPNARLCMASAVTGFVSTYGVDEPAGSYTDLDKANVVILWGNNPAEMHPVLFSRILARKERGESVTIIDIGTRRTRSTSHATKYIEFKPQADVAILNGIAHLLIKNKTWNKKFVDNFCNFRKDKDPSKPSLFGVASTFEEYTKLLEPYTPKYVEKISGVSAEDIRYLADLFGNPDLLITSLWCMGMNQHTRGTDVNRLVHGIHLLSGHFGRPGDAPTSLTGQPSACGTAREVGTLAHALPGGRIVKKKEHREQSEDIWNLPRGRINPKPGYHTVQMWESFSDPKGDITTLWVQVTNPGQSLPNLNRLFFPSRDLEDKFLIVSDVYPTATTKHADLILPSSLWVEKNGMYGNSERRTQQWFRMVKPPGDARDDCWQIIALARRLFDKGFKGMSDKDGKFLFEMKNKKSQIVPIWDWKRYYDINVDKHLFDEYRSFSKLKRKDLAPYDVYVGARGLRWPVVEQDDGTWRETEFRFVESDDPYVKKNAGIQFYNSTTKDNRAQIWFAPYIAPPESPDEAYPFWLCTGRVLEHWHTGSMTMRVPQLRRAMPQAYLEMHPDDARRLRLRDGERVIVESRRGSIELPLWLNGRSKVAKGSLFIPFFDEEILVNLVTLHDFCPISKEPDYKKCAVRVRSKIPSKP